MVLSINQLATSCLQALMVNRYITHPIGGHFQLLWQRLNIKMLWKYGVFSIHYRLLHPH